MKKYTLILLFCLATFYARGQATYVHWYDNYVESGNHNFPFNLASTTLFPDSLVQTSYLDAMGYKVLGSVLTHGAGEVFDPTSSMYDYVVSSLNASYTVDAIQLPYLYNYVQESGAAPDTLIFQFYTFST